MTVFSDEYLERERGRLAGRPAWDRSAIHDVLFSEAKAELRAWIEQEVLLLPQPGREKLSARLRHERHFLSAVNELAVAAALNKGSRKVIYEPDLGGVTPDLYLERDGESLPVVIEVWTRELTQGARGEERAWEALRARVGSIPVPVGLLVVPRGRRRAPTSAQAKAHASVLREWLLRADRPAGSFIERDGFRYIVHGPTPGLYAHLPAQHAGGAFDTAGVVEAIRDKTRRYGKLAAGLEAGLVVVVGADLRAPLTFDLLQAALEGKNAGAISWSAGRGGYLGELGTRIRPDERAPSFDKALSEVGWIDVGNGEPRLRTFALPTADRPICWSSGDDAGPGVERLSLP